MTSERFTYLDVLKAMAIIAVVLYHSGFLKYGYLGVDVFLVIAGFLATRSLLRRTGAQASGSIKGYLSFIVDRIIRLLPVLLAAGAVAMVVGWFTMLPDDYENLGESVVATNLFGNNILSAVTTGDYWNVANDYKPLMHTWYVGLLMQLFVVYALLCFVGRLDRTDSRKTLFVIVSTLTVLSLLYYFGCTDETGRFYYLPARFFEFAAGGMVALVYEPSQGRLFHPAFSYSCYGLLLVLLFVGYELVPAIVRLPLVVALGVVLLLSGDALRNPLTSNRVLARIGVASYSIFVWHQVLLAFYRYVIGNHFTFWTYLLFLAALGVVSWASYRWIEQRVARAMRSMDGRWIVLSVWLILTGFAGYVYLNAGVMRDVPELFVSVQDRHRRMNAEYTERGYDYDRPFVCEDKAHWLVIGDSFGRDFVNMVLESRIADQVEVSYMEDCSTPENRARFSGADRVFVARRILSRRLISEIEVQGWNHGLTPDKVVIVGEKSFGVNNGPVYAKRHRPDYFDQRVEPAGGAQFLARNKRLRETYGDRYLDLMSMVVDSSGRVPVFTPDHHFISLDCKHLGKAGARFFAERIEWGRFLE